MCVIVVIVCTRCTTNINTYGIKSPVVIKQRSSSVSRPGEIPRIIHQTWISTKLPAFYAPWLRSWLVKNPTWQYWFWTDDDIRNFIAHDYGQYLALYDSYKKNINRADAMRYFVLHKYGGLYADIDVECLRPLDDITSKHSCVLPEEHHAHSYLLHRRSPPANVVNAVMACRPGHPYFWKVIKELPRQQTQSDLLYQTGPFLIDAVLRKYMNNSTRPSEDNVAVLPPEVFNPTYDNTNLQRFKQKCKNTAHLLTHEREVCNTFIATNYANIPSNSSYTNHRWVHTYMTSYPTNGAFVNIPDMLRSVRDFFNFTAPSESGIKGGIPRYKFGPFK